MTIDPVGSPTIGSYRLISRLGVGGMGEVWLAEHQLLGRRAAIKVLLPRVSGVPEVVERFFVEARAATRIPDPGIVHIYDFGWHGDAAYIAMELLEGEVLSARVERDGRLPVAMALRLTHQVALTMAVAHARGIIHRDLKPENLFVIADAAVLGGERVKVLDFGIAKLLDADQPMHSRTQSGVLIGTPTYMSPEQCRGSSDIDHRTDIYALGCILYVLLAGRPPFVNELPGDMIVSHLMEEPEPPSKHGVGTPELDALVMCCLAKTRTERFATMTELAEALAARIADSSESASGERGSGTSDRDSARSPAAQIGELPTLAQANVPPPLQTDGSARWLIALVVGASVVVTALIFGAGRWLGDPPIQPTPAPMPADAGSGVDRSDSPELIAPSEVDAGVPLAVDAAEPRRARRKDAAVGSAASYLDP